MSNYRILLYFFIFNCIVLHVVAQPVAQPRPAQQNQQLTEEDSANFFKEMNPKTAATSSSLPFSPTYIKTLEDKVDSATRTDMLKTEASYHKYMFTQRMAIYNWQLNSGKILFFVVVLIVLIGLFLSYLQFKASTAHQEHQRKIKATVTTTAPAAESDTDAPMPTNKLEISKDGIKIDSAVIGLVILVISIAFFFMYLRYVFPVQTPGN